MRKVFLVAWREITQQLRSRGFILATVLTPIFLMGVYAFAGMLDSDSAKPASTMDNLAKASRSSLAVGYVDEAGFIRDIPPGIPDGLFVAFADESSAAEALKAKQIGAYYVLAPDYVANGAIKRFSQRMPLMKSGDADYLSWVLAWNAIPGSTVEEVARLVSPFDPRGLEFVPVGAEGLPSETDSGLGMGPFVVALLVMMPLFTAGGYLLQGLAREKENRVVEILLVSLRPTQMLAGKLLGLGTLTLIQFAAWVVLGGLTVQFTGHDPLSLLRSVNLSGTEPALIAAYAAGGFLLYATLMAGLGALAPNVEATRMWSFVVTGPMLLPIFLMNGIMSSPNGPLAIALSILPFCSPVAMLMRLMATSVATWEVALSLVVLVATAVLSLWAMSRLFRAGTLLSGQPISLSRFWGALKAA